MRDEFAARQRAIKLRLGGRPVQSICQALGRSEFWFHKWWRRYLESGAEGLYDLTHATHHIAQRISPELERTILSIRRRLQAHASPATRYRLIGAPAILAELKALDIRPLPHPPPSSACSSQRLDRAAGPARPAAATSGVPRPAGPSIQRTSRSRSGRAGLPQRQRPPLLHLGGQGCLRWGRLPAPGRLHRMDEVLGFLGECWKDLGMPEQVQLDNARELAGWGPAAHAVPGDPALLALWRKPAVDPGRGAAVQRQCGELQRLVPRAALPAAVPAAGRSRREFARLQEAVNTQHVHPRLGGQTPTQHRRGLRLRKLPTSLWCRRAAEAGGGSRDLHPASERGRDSHGPEPVVSSGEEA